jgi:hypothetical protein
MSDPLPHADFPDGIAQIHQNTMGDRNQVIGQMLGGIVINQLTIHDRVPAAAAPPPIPVTPALTQQEYRQRQVLLNKVKEYWVKGVLETSLHTRALIELGLQNRPDLVQRPFREVAEFPEVFGQTLVEGTSATTIFEQMGAGRTLLILGEPGSGKTITLLKLAEDLIARTEKDLSQPIPVVFNLSSWTRKPQAIEHWLIQELLEKYQVSKALGKQWVETESLILLLDGLDEVKAEQRNACVQALNQFMQTHGTTELTVCCRIKDYQALTEQLMLRSAVCIQPLTTEQIHSYFEQVGSRLKALRTVLRQDQELQGLATSPLMLSIMSLAYQDCAVTDVLQGGTPEDYHQHLFDTYIERMFQRRGTTQQYSQHWLIWLAQRMTDAAQTVFLIERLQPSWLPHRGQRIRYHLESSLIIGLIVGLIYGHGLSGGLNGGLISGLISGLMASSFKDIQPIETLKWSWKAAWQSTKLGCLLGLIIGLVYGLLIGLTSGIRFGSIVGLRHGLSFGLTSGILAGLTLGLISGLIGGFRGSEIQQKGKPNQGIRRSFRSAIILGLIFGLIFGLIYGLTGSLSEALRCGVIVGLVAALIGGGSACLRHIALRLMLYRNGYSLWNYDRFLDYAADRLFLQKVGGGYIFVHRMLMEHFAAMPLEQGRR